MNGKKKSWALSALLCTVFFLFSTGVALAYPKFYVKIDNRTDMPVRIQWHFHTRNGASESGDRFTTIAPHHTQRFWGPNGMGMMRFRYNAGGGDLRSFDVNGDTNPGAPSAFFYLKYDGNGHLRLLRPNG
jgi:hypothetical protein